MVLSVYLVTVIGIPVYMHYCGGELEKVNYVIKSNGCCGEEEDSDDMSGCCKDESLVARYSPDFTAKKINVGVDFILIPTDLAFSIVPHISLPNSKELSVSEFLFPPPKLLQNDIVLTSIIRI